MHTLEKEYAPASLEKTAERLPAETLEIFDQSESFISELQTSASFIDTAQKFRIETDESAPHFSAPDYWEAVRFVAEQEIDQGNYVGNDSLLQAMRIAAAAPDFIYKQQLLDTDTLSPQKKKRAKTDTSAFNGYLRDFVADNLDTPFRGFSSLLAYSASKGIPKDMIETAGTSMSAALVGVRTEVGFEQKATRANLNWQRGDAAQDLKGIDYIVEGIPVDIKTSLKSVHKDKDDLSEAAYKISTDKQVTLYPYDDAKNDYPNQTFRVTEEKLQAKSYQLAIDFYVLKQKLA